MIANTRPVKPKEIPIWTKRATLSKATKSWHSYMCDMVVNDFKESVLEVSNLPFDGEITPTHPTYHYTFPNGYNQVIILTGKLKLYRWLKMLDKRS